MGTKVYNYMPKGTKTKRKRKNSKLRLPERG